jgi:hypothetical protein
MLFTFFLDKVKGKKRREREKIKKGEERKGLSVLN